MTDLFRSCNGIDEFAVEVAGVWRSEAYPEQFRDLFKLRQQIGKRRVVRSRRSYISIETVCRDILSEQKYLARSVGCQHFCFGDDIVFLAAQLSAADVWNDAVTAETVASAGDGDLSAP